MDNNNNNNNPPHSEFNRFSYLTHHSIRARFTSTDVRHHVDIRGSYQRELEKERIRAELVVEEIVRRRMLEEEVRREMMLERELAFRRAEQGFGIGRSLGPMRRIETPRVPLLTSFEHRGGEVGFRGGLETMPFQRDPVVVGKGYEGENGGTLREIKEFNGVLAPSEGGSSKDKVIILAKPSANLADIKRKAMTPPVGGSIEVLKKQKSKEDWSCALCRITATSEQGLNEHLQGKKHKTRERGMITQRTGFGIGPSPKMSTSDTGEPFSLPTPSLKKDENVPNAKIVKERETVVKELPTDKPKKKFRFFCEDCQTGAFSLKVFNAHKRGKKHLRNLSERSKTDDASQADPSVHKCSFEENKGTEIVAIENKEIEGAQVETNGVVAKNNVDLLEDKESLEIVSVVEENKKVEMAAEETKEVEVTAEKTNEVTVTQGEQVETDGVDVDNDVTRVENKETDLEIVCSETVDVSGSDNVQMVPVQNGETVAPKTTDQEFVSYRIDDMQRDPEAARCEIIAPKTIEIDDMRKILEPVSGENVDSCGFKDN